MYDEDYQEDVEMEEDRSASAGATYSSDQIGMSHEIVRMALSTEYKSQLLKVKDIKETIKYSARATHKSTLDFLNIMSIAEKQLEDYFGFQLLRVPAKAANAKNDTKKDSNTKNKRMRTEEGATNVGTTTAAQEDRELYALNYEAITAIPNTDPDLPPRYGPHLINSDAFILRSTLPPEFRDIVGSCLPVPEKKYNGVVAIIVSTIALRGGSISQQDLTNLLVPLDLDFLVKYKAPSREISGLNKGPQEGFFTPMGSKLSEVKNLDDVIKIMESDQYLTKDKLSLRDSSGIEKTWITYMLGKRARREFTVEGVLSMLRDILGNNFTETAEEQAKDQLYKACLPKEAAMKLTW